MSLRVEVVDHGKGIPPHMQSVIQNSTQSGVGLRGMRERLRRPGGTLDIRSDGRGTKVIAVVPLPAKPDAQLLEKPVASVNLNNSAALPTGD